MKPTVVGSACQRVQAHLDDALATGTLSLPPELAAHAERCPNCGPEVAETERLLSRLRGAAAGIELGPVPKAVDAVLAQIAAENQPKVLPLEQRSRKRVAALWVIGQVAAVAAVLIIAIGGLGFALLKVNEAVSGVTPGDVFAKLAAPFHIQQAEVEKAK
jgi:anti-sigma factor RsiW